MNIGAGRFRVDGGRASRRPIGSLFLPLPLLFLLVAGGCSRVPKIIVLEDPLTAREHVDLGVAYERKGEQDLARREYERALRKDGKSFRARVNLGNVFLAKKEYGSARGEYLRALELRPGDPEATNNLSWAAIDSGVGIEEALARMESVVSGPGGRKPALLDTLGVLRMHANRPGPAEEAFAAADALCRDGVAAPGKEGKLAPPCPEEVRREIAEHRGELRKRIASPPTAPTR